MHYDLQRVNRAVRRTVTWALSAMPSRVDVDQTRQAQPLTLRPIGCVVCLLYAKRGTTTTVVPWSVSPVFFVLVQSSPTQ